MAWIVTYDTLPRKGDKIVDIDMSSSTDNYSYVEFTFDSGKKLCVTCYTNELNEALVKEGAAHGSLVFDLTGKPVVQPQNQMPKS